MSNINELNDVRFSELVFKEVVKKVEKQCLRCELHTAETDSEFCKECGELLEQASKLVYEDPKVAKYYEKIVSTQKKAQVQLKVLYKHLETGKGPTAVNVLKKTGRGIKKFYSFSLFTEGIKFTKKVIPPIRKNGEEELPIEKTEHELILEEIIQLEEIVSIEPIEYVIYEYLTPDKEQTVIEEQETKKKTVFGDTLELFIIRFSKLEKQKQVTIGLILLTVTSGFLLYISFL